MLEAILESFFGFVIECLIALSWWVLLFPVVWLVSLPFILTISLFRRQPYGLAVTEMLTSVHIFWGETGMIFCSAM
jgi:predicted ferric reductase